MSYVSPCIKRLPKDNSWIALPASDDGMAPKIDLPFTFTLFGDISTTAISVKEKENMHIGVDDIFL